MRLGYCIACQHGHHDRHQKIIQAAPEGMLGGAMCRCEGECVGRVHPDDKRIADALMLHRKKSA